MKNTRHGAARGKERAPKILRALWFKGHVGKGIGLFLFHLSERRLQWNELWKSHWKVENELMPFIPCSLAFSDFFISFGQQGPITFLQNSGHT